MFRVKDHFYLVALVLLALNAIFLYYNFWHRSSANIGTALQEEVLKLSEVELKYVLNGYRIPALHPSATTKIRPASIFVFVHEQHCDVCKQEARPYWRSLAELKNADFRVFYYSRQPRGWERFALWMELSKEHIIPVSFIAREDTLLWSSSAPSIIVVDNHTKEIKLAHAGSSHLRKRSILFYEYLIQYLARNSLTQES